MPAGAMRQVDWAELVARLSAARDLHSVLAPGHTRASFAPAVAGLDNREPTVNQCVSAVGKGVQADCRSTISNTGKSDREPL